MAAHGGNIYVFLEFSLETTSPDVHFFFSGISSAMEKPGASPKGSDIVARKRARRNLLACGASNLILLVCVVVAIALYILKGNYCQ